MDFGAFVEILPGKEGLCHISKLSRSRVEKVTDVLKEGQVIPVKLLEIDRTGGRLSLSYIDAIDPDGEKKMPPRSDRKPRFEHRDGKGFRGNFRHHSDIREGFSSEE